MYAGQRFKGRHTYDTAALLEYFETDDEDVVREELAKRGITAHESAGRMFVSGYELEDSP